MKKQSRFFLWIPFLFLTLLLNGCTQEKAGALKIAAIHFRDEAVTALQQIDTILTSAVSLPEDQQVITFNDLRNLTPDQFRIDQFLKRSPEPELLTERKLEFSNKMIQSINDHYNSFAAIFTDLTEGHLFASQAVEKCEKHAVNLTLGMINLAGLLREDKIRVCSNAKRILLSERIKQDLAEKNPEIKDILLLNAVEQIKTLQQEEASIKDSVIKQCLKAAETGKLVISLIRTYKSISVNDIRNLTAESRLFINGFNNEKTRLDNLIMQYQSFKASLQKDPYYADLIE